MGFGKSSQSASNTSQQTSVANNQSYPFLQGALGDQATHSADGSNAVRALLGLDGDTGQAAAFKNFQDSSGYDFIRQQGLNGIDAGQAAGGNLNSGATFKAKSKYSSGLASNFLNTYLQSLMGLTSSGQQAGSILASAGNTSNSQGTSSGTSKGSSMNFTTG